MKFYWNEKIGYYCIEDLSEGCKVLSMDACEALSNELDKIEKASERIEGMNDLLKEQLAEERSRNAKLISEKENNEGIEQLRKQLEDARIKIAELRTILSEKDNQIDAERLYIGRLESDNKKLIYALGASNGIDRAVGYFGGVRKDSSVLGIEGNKVYDYMRKQTKVIDSIISRVSQNYDFGDDNNPD